MDLLQEVVELRSAGKALQWSRNVGIQNQRAGSRAASMVTFTGKLTAALRRSSRVRGPTFLVSGLLDLTGGREDALSY